MVRENTLSGGENVQHVREMCILDIMNLGTILRSNLCKRLNDVLSAKSSKKTGSTYSLTSDTGNRTPSCRVKGGNVSRYTISDISIVQRDTTCLQFSSKLEHFYVSPKLIPALLLHHTTRTCTVKIKSTSLRG